MRNKGQIIVMIAILLPVVLVLLALSIDAGRLFIERDRLTRAAQGAADAGISVVAERMVTQVVLRQTTVAGIAGLLPTSVTTPTPPLSDLPAWLTEEDRITLVSPINQTAAASEALTYMDLNGYPEDDPAIRSIQITYPQPGYRVDDHEITTLRMSVGIRRATAILLAGLLHRSSAILEAEAHSSIPQR